jgi:predicted amidohydrolase
VHAAKFRIGLVQMACSHESIPDPSTGALCRLAAELGVVVAASLFERRTAGVYHNTAAIINAGDALLGIFRKMHIPDDPLYFENFYFTPGDLGFRRSDTRYGRIAFLVCRDRRYRNRPFLRGRRIDTHSVISGLGDAGGNVQ